MDNNVPPNNTLLVVDALIKANKDFDLIMLPNRRHGYGSASNYMMRRRWDYLYGTCSAPSRRRVRAEAAVAADAMTIPI